MINPKHLLEGTMEAEHQMKQLLFSQGMLLEQEDAPEEVIRVVSDDEHFNVSELFVSP